MDEEWLEHGQLHHAVYSVHRLAWLLIAVAVLSHLVGVVQRDSLPLAGWLFSPRLRSGDQPRDWPSQLAHGWRRGR